MLVRQDDERRRIDSTCFSYLRRLAGDWRRRRGKSGGDGSDECDRRQREREKEQQSAAVASPDAGTRGAGAKRREMRTQVRRREGGLIRDAVTDKRRKGEKKGKFSARSRKRLRETWGKIGAVNLLFC